MGAKLFGKFRDHLLLVINGAGVADQAAQAHRAALGKLHDSLADVVGRVHGHHLAGNHDVDFLRLAVANGHGEPAADYVAENVVKGIIQPFALFIGAERFEHIDRGDDAPSRTTDAGLGPAGFNTPGAAVSGLADIVEFNILALLAQGVEY